MFADYCETRPIHRNPGPYDGARRFVTLGSSYPLQKRESRSPTHLLHSRCRDFVRTKLCSTGMTPKTCPRCGENVPSSGRGRPPVWCSQACRRAAYEERRASASGAIAVRVVKQEAPPLPPPKVTLDEHVADVLASPTATARVLSAAVGLAADGRIHEPRWARAEAALMQLQRSGSWSRQRRS